MKISETRKAIIELIEPFIHKERRNENLSISKGPLLFENVILFSNKETGFYDITAVFSYITNKDGNYESNEAYEDVINIRDYFTKKIGEISNKPLHLYTEEEDKQLLGILEQLK